MAVTPTTSTSSTTQTKTTDASKQGFNGLTADDFFKLLIAQLQNQDPSSPTSNEDLLNQISTIRSLQSNVEVGDTLKSLNKTLTANNSIAGQGLSVAASFIGNPVSITGDRFGIVQQALMKDGQTYVVVDGKEVAVSEIKSVQPPESLVDHMVGGTTTTNGVTKDVFGVVTEVGQQNGKVYVTLAKPSEKQEDAGKLIDAAVVPLDSIKSLYSYDSFVGKTVRAKDATGKDITGQVQSTPQLINGKPSYLIGGSLVPATNIVTVISSSTTSS